MSERPPSIWTRPWRGPARLIAWLALLALAVFLALLVASLLLNPTGNCPDRVVLSGIGALLVAGMLAGVVAFVRWIWCWRNCKRFLSWSAGLAAVVVLVFVEEGVRGRLVWQKHCRTIEARGEKLTLSAIVPPLVPEDQNFAMAPLLKPLWAFTRGTNGLVWSDTNGLARLQATSAELLPGRNTNDHLALGSLENGTYANLETCALFYRGNTNYPQAAPGSAPAETILGALARLDPAIQGLREASALRPAARFPILYEFQPPWDILLPHLAHVKGLTRLCQTHAVAELEAGRPEQSFEDLKLGFRLSDSIHEEPLLIDHLVRLASLALDLQVVREGLVRHAWTEAQLAELETRLARINLLAEYKTAMRGERVLGTAGLDYLRRHSFRSEGMNYIADEDGRSGHALLTAMPSGWFYQNMLTISRFCQDYTLPAVDENAHRVFPEVSDAGAQVLARMRGPYTYFAKLLTPALDKAVRKSARMQVYVDATRVACALERYRQANGKVPATLEPLAPDFIPAIPVDVIDGNPLRYRVSSDGSIVLYSIGWNRTDDGGKLEWMKGNEGGTIDMDRGDWVWQLATGR